MTAADAVREAPSLASDDAHLFRQASNDQKADYLMKYVKLQHGNYRATGPAPAAKAFHVPAALTCVALQK